MYDPNLQNYPYAFPTSPHLVDWSAFPSDTAAFFSALAFGLACLSRRLAIPLTLYVAEWICLPRMFLGVHYASDVVAGATIGIVLVWASLNVGWLQSVFAARLLGWAEAKPGVFYAAAFLASFEMGVLFEDIREGARTSFHIADVEYGKFIRAGFAAIAAVGFLAVAVYSCSWLGVPVNLKVVRRRATRQPAHRENGKVTKVFVDIDEALRQ
jgi:hypothetical protein